MSQSREEKAEQLREEFLKALDGVATLGGRLATTASQAATALAIGTRAKESGPADDLFIAALEGIDKTVGALEAQLRHVAELKSKLGKVVAGPMLVPPNETKDN